jgi:hypothetical protein
MSFSPFNTGTLNPKYNLTPYIATTIKAAILCGRHFVVIHAKQTRHEKKKLWTWMFNVILKLF